VPYTEKEAYYILCENKELKENNLKLIEKKEELERKLKLLNMKLEEDENFQIRESIYNKECQEIDMEQKIKDLEEEKILNKGKIEILEGLVKNELKIEEIFKTMPEKELMHYLNDIVIKNINQKENLRKENKVLLENLIVLTKEYTSKQKINNNNDKNKNITKAK
jgi:hypothetical protein